MVGSAQLFWSSIMVDTFDMGVCIYTYTNLCTTNFLWVLYFGEVGELPDFFQIRYIG